MIHNQHGSFLFMKITQECTVNIISCIQLEVELKSGFVLSGKYFASFFFKVPWHLSVVTCTY